MLPPYWQIRPMVIVFLNRTVNSAYSARRLSPCQGVSIQKGRMRFSQCRRTERIWQMPSVGRRASATRMNAAAESIGNPDGRFWSDWRHFSGGGH